MAQTQDLNQKQLRFARLCLAALQKGHVQGEDGIGTMKEKNLHALLKFYLCEDPSCHEVPLKETGEQEGQSRMIADVLCNGTAYEVQTGSFFPLKKKVAYYLEKTPLHLTIVCPLAAVKRINLLDGQTGEVVSRRKSPKRMTEWDALGQIYWIKEWVTEKRLTVKLLLLEEEEYRLKDERPKRRGWKRPAQKFDCYPTQLLDEIDLCGPEDYVRFIPKELEQPFAASQYAQKTGLRGVRVYGAIQILEAAGLVEKAEKKGRAQLYRILSQEPEVEPPDE